MPGEFFFFFFKQTRASWSEDMDYTLLKNVHVRKFPLSLSEREGFERESFKREGDSVEMRGRQCRDESTQAEKVVSRLNR